MFENYDDEELIAVIVSMVAVLGSVGLIGVIITSLVLKSMIPILAFLGICIVSAGVIGIKAFTELNSR